MNAGTDIKILTFQVGPQAWVHVSVDLNNIRYISFAADWSDSTYSLHINGEPVFARLKRTEYASAEDAIKGEDL